MRKMVLFSVVLLLVGLVFAGFEFGLIDFKSDSNGSGFSGSNSDCRGLNEKECNRKEGCMPLHGSSHCTGQSCTQDYVFQGCAEKGG